MKFLQLIERSSKHLDKIASPTLPFSPPFTFGAHWMCDRLNEIRSQSIQCDPVIPFERYGWLKYGTSFFAFLLSLLFLYWVRPSLAPLSVLIFYLAEVHFLFLFPLLLDKSEHPVRQSIRETYKIGVWKALVTVLPIGGYMIIGLANVKNPLRNWYVGCMSILFWYHDEMGHRL